MRDQVDDTRDLVDDTTVSGVCERGARVRETGSRPGLGPLFEIEFGGVLLSHNPSVAVPSALSGLASGFGMGPGVSLTL